MYITIMNSDHLVTKVTLELHTFVLLLFWYLYGPLIFNPFELSTLLTFRSAYYTGFKYREIDFKTAEYFGEIHLRPNDVRLLLTKLKF
jgi:hypothetical protein